MAGDFSIERRDNIRRTILDLETVIALLFLDQDSKVYDTVVKRNMPKIIDNITLLDYYITGSIHQRNVEQDFALLNNLYYRKGASLYLSTDENLEPTFININIRDMTINLYGDENLVNKFKELVKFKNADIKRIQRTVEAKAGKKN
jgi:hypothetical protein